MKAEIGLHGPVKFGKMWELQAEIWTADGTVRTKSWSLHGKKEDAEEYRDRFNSQPEGEKTNEQ